VERLPRRLEHALPLRADTQHAVLALRYDGHDLASSDRADLLAKVRAGQFAGRLEVEAITYIQRATPNRNALRFKPSILRAFAKSFAGQPVLRDHQHDDLAARAGTITKSALEYGEDSGDKEPRIRQVLELSKPWAIEAALDGTLDRFSIAWHSQRPPDCSVCGDPVMSAYFGGGDCEHWPGDEVLDGEETVIAEAIYTDATGIETSAVSVPAVEGTHVEEIRSALAARRSEKEQNTMKSVKTFAAILAALSLPADADEAAVLAGVERERALFEAEKEAHDAVRTRLVEAEGALAKLRAERESAELDRLIDDAIRHGKIPGKGPGGEASKGEAAIRTLAATSFGAAEQWVAGLERQTPAGAPPIAPRLAPAPAGQPAPAVALTGSQKQVNRLLGIPDEVFLKHGRPEGLL